MYIYFCQYLHSFHFSSDDWSHNSKYMLAMPVHAIPYMCAVGLLEIFRVQNTRHIAFLSSLKSQGCNKCGTDTRTVLSRQYLNWILLLRVLLGRPIQNLAQSLCTTGFEVRVLVEDRSVGTNVARLIPLLRSDCCNTTRRQASRASSNQLGQAADEFEFGVGSGQAKFILEQITRLRQVLEWVPMMELELDKVVDLFNLLFNERQE
jgi:hypothetical protein